MPDQLLAVPNPSSLPHGGTLRESMLPADRLEEGKQEASVLPFLTVTEHQQCDLELLVTGAYSPLQGFMTQAVYESVVNTWRLPDGLAWSVPIVLEVDDALAGLLGEGARVALRDREGVNLAILTVADKWTREDEGEANAQGGDVASSRDGGDGPHRVHEAAPPATRRYAKTYVGGPVEGLALPERYGFDDLYQAPAAVRATLAECPREHVLAVHTREPLHRFECEHAVKLATELDAALLIHPSDSGTDFNSLERMSRLRSYRAAVNRLNYPARLLLLPYSARECPERERVLHAIIRQNFGATHMVSFERASQRRRPEDRESRCKTLLDELDIESIAVHAHGYDPAHGAFTPTAGAGPDMVALPSPDEVSRLLRNGEPVPEWFTYPEVVEALAAVHRPAAKRGLVVFFTGLSGSGKSTIGRYVFGRLLEEGSRPVTLLDGDEVRQHLSSELGFSKEHRDLNIRRIGYVAAEIAKNGGIAVCAPIAPYASTRNAVRDMVERNGTFIEIHVATPLEVCEARDRKGLYALARAGKIKEFTGISDPYEVPDQPTLRIDTSQVSPQSAGEQVLVTLAAAGFLSKP